MKTTKDTITVNGEVVAFEVSIGFNRVNATFYFPHRTCVERNFVLDAPESFCLYKAVDQYRTYTAVRFSINSSGFDEMIDVLKYCASSIHEVQWFPVARGKNFWKELDLWFAHNLFGFGEEINALLNKGYSLEDALHEYDLVTDFTENSL